MSDVEYLGTFALSNFRQYITQRTDGTRKQVSTEK